MDPDLLAKAQQLLPDCDYLVDAYEAKMIWGSKKALEMTGYSEAEVPLLKNIDLIPSNLHNEFQSQFPQRLMKDKFVRDQMVKIKNGSEVKMKLESLSFNYNGATYIVGKILSVLNE